MSHATSAPMEEFANLSDNKAAATDGYQIGDRRKFVGRNEGMRKYAHGFQQLFAAVMERK